MARLGDLERVVMDVLWDRHPGPATGEGTDGLTVRDVVAAMPDRGPAYTTVMTVLDRLAGKGMVVRVRDGRAWRYRPAAPREAYIARLMLDALDLAQTDGAPAAADGGDRRAALVRFARSVTGREAELLRAALAEQAGGDDADPAGGRTDGED